MPRLKEPDRREQAGDLELVGSYIKGRLTFIIS